MNEDIEYPAPDAVKRVREEVKAADGICFLRRNTITFSRSLEKPY